jgi:hypothetical protein
MERGEGTRGKVAALVSGANAIEIKATIPESQVDSTLARFGLTVPTTRSDTSTSTTPRSST